MIGGTLQKKKWIDVNPRVFGVSSALIAGILAISVVATEAVEGFFDTVQKSIVGTFGWFYVLATTGMLLFMVWLMISRFGNVRLGDDDSRPEFSTASWFAMLFSAGMGIGMLFYGVAEPVLHFSQPPVAEAQSVAAARDALPYTFLHWGLHPWGIYAAMGLALAYFGFRRKLPLSVRSAFYPLLGRRIYGVAGDVIDIAAVVTTIFGVSSSLGMGASQVSAGLNHLFGIPETMGSKSLIVLFISLAATASVVSGLNAGIRRLSELNMGLAACLLLFVFLWGPTFWLLNVLVQNVGGYLYQLPASSFWTASLADEGSKQFYTNWTIPYWAWWIAWAPFVGMFIARISKGRTIREFLMGVLFVPTAVGVVWFTVLGNTALHLELFQDVALVEAVQSNIATALYKFFESFPLGQIAGAACTVSVVLFFVTSSDSASLVVDTIASGGKEDGPVWQRIFWAMLTGVVAAILMFAGGLKALQTASLVTALPFSVVMVGMCYCLYRSLRQEKLPQPAPARASMPITSPSASFAAPPP
jgi:choline/glycine/proline betaine transport protein